MAKVELRHDMAAKAEWIFYAAVGVVGCVFIIYCLIQISYFWGQYQAGVYSICALLVLIPTASALYISLQRVFVWSVVYIEGNIIKQILLNCQMEIDISKDFEKIYVFFISPSTVLRQPAYEWLELRQNGHLIRIMPRRLSPKVPLADLPGGLREIWQQYMSEHV